MARIQKSDPYFSRLYLSGFMIVMLVGLAVLLVLQFASHQYDRDMRDWQVRLGLIADSRLNAVDSWLELQFEDMRQLAANPSVRSFVAKENAEWTLGAGRLSAPIAGYYRRARRLHPRGCCP